MGYQFRGSSASEQTFNIHGTPKKVEMLKLFEFDSDRKRMSSIIRDGGVVKLLIKGADNIIKERLAPNQPYLPFIEE
jgi:phospholipid-transporting ATPase